MSLGEKCMLKGRSRQCFFILPVISLAFPAIADEIKWPEAVARLALERTLAENCVERLKKYGDAAARNRGSVEYGEAKGEFDGVIAGLVVALARNGQPASLPSLRERLERGFMKREGFCRSVEALGPSYSGEKGLGPFFDIVGGTVKPLVDAAVAIWFRAKDDNALMRKTIQTQLEATVWPPFDKVTFSP
jgi:hypothetical protein